MPQVRPVAKIHAAAAYFAFVSRNPNQIAKAFNLKNVRTVHRWSETPEWEEVLEVPAVILEIGTSNTSPPYILSVKVMHPLRKPKKRI